MKQLLKRFRAMVDRRKVIAEELGSIDRALTELRELLPDAPAAAVDRRTEPERRKVERRKPRKHAKPAARNKKQADRNKKESSTHKPPTPAAPPARREPAVTGTFDDAGAIAALSNGARSTREVAAFLGIGEAYAKGQLSRMAKAGRIERVGWARGAKWQAPAAAIARAQKPAPPGFDVVFDGSRTPGSRPS